MSSSPWFADKPGYSQLCLGKFFISPPPIGESSVALKGGGVKHSNNHSPNIITYTLQYISPLYDGRNATVIL